MPAVLTELGFISTPEEERYLNSAGGVQALARSIYNGIVKYRVKQGGMSPQAITPIILPDAIDKPEPPRVSDGSNDLNVANAEPAVVPVDPNPQPATAAKERGAKEETPENKGKGDEMRPASVRSDNGAATRRQSAGQQRSVAKPDSTPARAAHAERVAKQSRSAEQGKPVFKVQIFVVDRQLKANDARLKGLQNVGFYKEGRLYKYTIGESTSYNEIRQVQKSLGNKCPGNFIVAFKNGQRMNLSEAIRLSK